MSIHIQAPANVTDHVSDCDTESSASDEDNDQTFDDWASDSAQQPCQSLFEDKELPSAILAMEHDKKTYGFDLDGTCSNSALDFHGRIRLINFIRKTKPAPADLPTLVEQGKFLKDDEYLIPALEDDPLLHTQSTVWSDSEDEDEESVPALKKKLAKAKQELVDYRTFVGERLNVSTLRATIDEPLPPTSESASRDDDSHYFQSYGENDIHAVMIQDQVRTSTYASFILTNPALFRDAVVLDVGCGTGILSLFAAQGGAKRVIAVDASDIGEKARKIVKANGLEDVITVIRGKVEEITLPDGIEHVDIIISEWMGYGLLYESMLDSVLHARERFLRPETGIMAPSQCQMMLGLCDAAEIHKERVGFWSDVYGFDLSTMAEGLYDEAIIDVVEPEDILSGPCVVKDLHLGVITPRQLDFTSSFSLTSTAQRKSKVHALILYFDTFFTVSGAPVPPNTEVKVVKKDDAVLAEVWPVGGKPPPQRRQSHGKEKEKITSFSTGPKSIPTHWKQTLFLLREPILVDEGTVVEGTFYCKKSQDNSRELDVEIHYTVRGNAAAATASEMVVQMFKVR